MIKETVLEHKLEKENYLSKNYIKREKINFANKFLETDLIKVISGVRRAGKSVFSILLLSKKKFAYLNFDDEELLKVDDYGQIIKAIYEVYSDAKYILFDEIQNLNNWELFVNKLQRRGYNLVITGSNAKLLSKELATSLTGRYIPVEIFPFSFREFLRAKNFEIKRELFNLGDYKGKILNYLEEYVKFGGFPEVIVKNLEAKTYVETLFDSILLKDVVKRYKIRFPQKIYELGVYLVSNFSSEFSYTRLRKFLNFRSTLTVENYIRYLEEAFLIFPLNRFSFKIKEQIKTPKKNYVIDNSIILAKSFKFSKDIGKLMENLVFVELLRRGYKNNENIFYYKTKNGREIDFVIRSELKIKELIEVCYDIYDFNTKERKVKALIKAKEELNCERLSIITWDYEGEEKINKQTIVYRPLWKWLLTYTFP